MNHTERTHQQQVRQTHNLIRLQGQRIDLFHRGEPTSDGQGGFTDDGSLTEEDTPISQRNRFVGGVSYHRLGFEGQTLHGEQRDVPIVIVGMPDDDIRKNDEFVWNGNRYRVEYIHPQTSYEIKGECEWLEAVDA